MLPGNTVGMGWPLAEFLGLGMGWYLSANLALPSHSSTDETQSQKNYILGQGYAQRFNQDSKKDFLSGHFESSLFSLIFMCVGVCVSFHCENANRCYVKCTKIIFKIISENFLL